MIIREAQVADIEQMHSVRMSVVENILPGAGLITVADYEDFLTRRGRGWVCQMEDTIAGIAIVDVENNNVWALFLRPIFEGRGIGKKLHDTMLNWYFGQTDRSIWLGTAPGTRAETFYQKAGWQPTGFRPNGEIRFEMSLSDWKRVRATH
jgi:GNAT superfamily N-acetyltransferase